MEDKGKHYRYTYNGIKMDPYRIAKIYDLGGGPREHATKKLLRGVSKGHTERDLIAEVRACMDRWEEMIDEDENPAVWVEPGVVVVEAGPTDEMIRAGNSVLPSSVDASLVWQLMVDVYLNK